VTGLEVAGELRDLIIGACVVGGAVQVMLATYHFFRRAVQTA
jgi:hypothetical protein